MPINKNGACGPTASNKNPPTCTKKMIPKPPVTLTTPRTEPRISFGVRSIVSTCGAIRQPAWPAANNTVGKTMSQSNGTVRQTRTGLHNPEIGKFQTAS